MIKNRRNFIKTAAATAVFPFGAAGEFRPAHSKKTWPPFEGPTTPKICMMCPLDASEDRIRQIKQLGVNYINISGGMSGWKEDEMRSGMEHLKKNGLTPLIRMHSVSPAIVLARPGRDADIDVFRESVRVAGASGLPTVEYNFYVDRLIEGYYETSGRGGAGVTGYDYSRGKDIPAKPEIGVHKADAIWANLKYFLDAVIPVAEKAGVQLIQKGFDTATSSKKETIYKLNALAAEFYHYILTKLPAGKHALEYLTQTRHMRPQTVDTYKLGFAPSSGNALVQYLLKKKQIKIDDILEAGLASKWGGNIVDFFQGRVMFPLHDHRGNIIGFSGRIMDANAKTAKYINTRETLVYHKGSVFFGLDSSKEAIKKTNGTNRFFFILNPLL